MKRKQVNRKLPNYIKFCKMGLTFTKLGCKIKTDFTV
nr:MAG TPA: hypothetical protein [Caudoviricetes sp.]